MKLNDVFDIFYGVNLELINCEIDNENGIPFVSRTSENNGIVAHVKIKNGVIPNPAGSISCAGSGSVLSAFVQEKEYYSGRDLYILNPKNKSMTIEEKLWYCSIISQNKYRYSYGRQANRTLKYIEIPDTIPSWVYNINFKRNKRKMKSIINYSEASEFNLANWKRFKLKDIFSIERGKVSNLTFLEKGKCPIVSAYGENQGISFYANEEIAYSNCFTASMNGSKSGYVTYHEYGFNAGTDCGILKPKFKSNIYIGLFISTIMKKNSYKYAYGRKLTIQRLEEEIIPLPAAGNTPDWNFMVNYIKSLPYSDKI